MYNSTFFYDFIKTEDGDKHKRNLHAIHFNRLIAYNKEWKIHKILLFEYMLLCCKKYGNNFTQTTTLIINYTRMGKNSVLKYIAVLEKEGYLDVQRSKDKNGTPELNRYSINFDNIISSLDSIYLLPEKDVSHHKDELTKMYKFIEDNPYNN